MIKESSWGQRLNKSIQYLRRGNLAGLATEAGQYLTWKQMQYASQSRKSTVMHPAEFLLPQIRKEITIEEFPFIVANRENSGWSKAELEAKILELGPWEYYFAFAHGLTTEISGTFNQTSADHHRFRSKLISETIVELLGAELNQTQILDLACHNGIFTLDLAFRGAGSVLGVEVRDWNLQKANFLKAYYQIPKATFEQGDVYSLDGGAQADVVMCLGILYHVIRPVDLVEFCYQNCRKFAVIDTNCRREPLSAYYVTRGVNADSPIEGTRSIELTPTYRAVIDTMQEVGFAEVVEVIGVGEKPILYSDFTRRCFIGFKDRKYLDNIADILYRPQ